MNITSFNEEICFLITCVFVFLGVNLSKGNTEIRKPCKYHKEGGSAIGFQEV